MTTRSRSVNSLSKGMVAATMLLFPGAVAADERCKMKVVNEAANSQYTEQHVLDVGDVAGHQIRIFELHRTFPDSEPDCEGLKKKESWSHGYSDYVDRNGRAWGYTVLMMENGDKIFGEFSGTSHTVVNADGSRASTYTGVVTYTGGTGIYTGIRGISRDSIVFDPEKNYNEAVQEVEYWFEK